MRKAIGIKTGKVYASGRYRSEVFRQLHADYPTVTVYSRHADGKRTENNVLPEAVKVV